MTTAIYARISLDRQDGAGVERQLKVCRAVVKRQGWGPAQEFVDNSVSAFTGKVRPAHTAMLDAVKAGEVDRIVVYDLDRLYRRPAELETLIELADRGRIQVVTCQGDLNIGTDDGVTMARVLVTFANKASRDTSRRLKAQKAQARDKGLALGGPRAFGWRAVPRMDEATGQPILTPAGKPSMKLTTELEPREAALLSRAVDDLMAGASCIGIARQWNEAGVLQPQAGKALWTGDGIRRLLGNPKHAAIVTRDKFEQLQAVLASRGVNGHTPRRRSLLTGIVECSKCHLPMTRNGTGRKGQQTSAWRCYRIAGANRGGCGRSVGAAGLEALLVAATLRLVDGPRFAAILRQQSRQGDAARGLLDQLGALDRRLDSLATVFATGKLSATAYQKATSAVQREQRALQVKLGRASVSGVMAPFAGKAGALRAAWPTLSVDQQRQVIGLALGKVTIGPAAAHGPRQFDVTRVHWKG